MFQITAPNNVTSQYVYNGFGELRTVLSADAGSNPTTGELIPINYRYDQAGNRIYASDARGVETVLIFDALNRPLLIDYPFDADTTFVYDEHTDGQNGIGRLTRMIDETGTTHYRYDLRGNLLEKEHIDADNISMRTGYDYDAADRVITMTYPSKMVVNYQRNALGRVQSVTAKPFHRRETTMVADNIEYSPLGALERLEFGNGIVETRAYDAAGRLSAIESSLSELGTFAFDYDSAGNLTHEIRSADSGNGLETYARYFQYDNANRLIAERDENGPLIGHHESAARDRATL